MKKIAKIFFVIILFLFCLNIQNSNAKINDLILDFDKVKKKLPFKKKQPEPKPKMVETKQEWELEAQNVPLEERKVEKYKPEIDTKKYNIPEIKYVFEKFNSPLGGKELNIEDVKKRLYHYPYLVADNGFKYVAYPYYYYSPESDQIYSRFFVEKLDTSKTKTKRILDYEHKQKERIPVLESGTMDYYQHLYSGLSLVDWSKDSKKLLIKEKIGSALAGIYKTNLYVHILADDIENSKTIQLDILDETIKNYFLDWENKQLIKYKYDIQPLGFNEANDNEVIALCWVMDNEGNKINLGVWSYDISTNEIKILEQIPNISINGMFLRDTF